MWHNPCFYCTHDAYVSTMFRLGSRTRWRMWRFRVFTITQRISEIQTETGPGRAIFVTIWIRVRIPNEWTMIVSRTDFTRGCYVLTMWAALNICFQTTWNHNKSIRALASPIYVYTGVCAGRDDVCTRNINSVFIYGNAERKYAEWCANGRRKLKHNENDVYIK